MTISQLTQPGRLADLLGQTPVEHLEFSEEFWGFGGLHGGLALALMAGVAEGRTPRLRIRSISGHFHRSARESLSIESRPVHAGRSAHFTEVLAQSGGGTCITGLAILGPPQMGGPSRSPSLPDVPLPSALVPLESLTGKPPVMEALEIRPVRDLRPYSGGEDASMSAWMKLRQSEAPLTPRSVIFFLDALPPSYAGILSEQRAVPTLELSVHLADAAPTSPWIFVESTTLSAGEGGWVTESIDAWDVSGVHLGHAQQLRLALDVRRPIST